MKATVLYYSHKGRTANYAREMAMYLWSKGLDVSLCAITEFDRSRLQGTDLLLLGCWTSGWFVVHQHPHSRWKEAASGLKDALPERILLFTTYKIRTGSMFRNMARVLGIPRKTVLPELRSRSGILTDGDRKILDNLIKEQLWEQKN